MGHAFGNLSRKSLTNLRLQRLSPMFYSRSFRVPCLTFSKYFWSTFYILYKSTFLKYFWSTFYILYEVWIKIIFSIWTINCPSSIYWKNCSFFAELPSHLCRKLVVYIWVDDWVYFWTLSYFMDLIMPKPHCFDYHRFIISLEIREC